MNERKAIPIGISDFKQFHEKGYYYVDKTGFIKELLDNKAYVTLFTRPRRFGKTLNLSMLKYFFEKTEEDNSYLFNGLKIWESGEEYRAEQGKYPVISLTFKDTKMNTWDQTYEEIIEMIALEYDRHSYLIDNLSNEYKKDVFNKIKAREANLKDYASSIKNLCMYLEEYYGQKPIVLIDEYDVPLQNSYILGFYDETILSLIYRHNIKYASYTNFK